MSVFDTKLESILESLPDDEAEEFLKLPEILQREFIAELIKNDFLLLVYLLGYDDIGEFHFDEIEKLSKVRFIDNSSVRRLYLWSRGYFKTSLITQAHTIWLILNNPNLRILIVSNTLGIARKILGDIKEHFMTNDKFRRYFPDYCPKANSDGKIEFGTIDYFTIPNRQRKFKEPTAMCAGIGTNLTGLHFDYMKIDDLVTKDSVSNETQIQASKDYYGSLRQLFDNPTIPREDIIGTIYHFNDLHNNMKDNKEFILSFIPAANDMTFNKITFKERFTKEGLENILNDPAIGPYIFSTQYQLNPINPADVKFLEDWLKWYDSAKLGLSEYICVDPASTQKKKSDYTVITRWGIDAEGLVYLLYGIRDKLTVFDRINIIVQQARAANNLRKVKYEALGGRHGDLEQLRQTFIKERLHISPTETKATSATKQDRIEQRLVGQFHAGIIHLPKQLYYRSCYDGKTYDFIQQFKLEYLQFPFCEHDDILDCSSQLFEEPLIKGSKKTTPVPDDEFEWLRNRAIEEKRGIRRPSKFSRQCRQFGIPSTISFR